VAANGLSLFEQEILPKNARVHGIFDTFLIKRKNEILAKCYDLILQKGLSINSDAPR
jgi:hypothetical protein